MEDFGLSKRYRLREIEDDEAERAIAEGYDAEIDWDVEEDSELGEDESGSIDEMEEE